MPDPALKHLHVLKGTTFDYPFQYLKGGGPVNLTGYSATWTITPLSGGSPIILHTGNATGQSGVFFGGQANDLTNGMIDLIFSATDTSVFTWQAATYTFVVTDPLNNVHQLLTGGIGTT